MIDLAQRPIVGCVTFAIFLEFKEGSSRIVGVTQMYLE
jgi:hypothetical protein